MLPINNNVRILSLYRDPKNCSSWRTLFESTWIAKHFHSSSFDDLQRVITKSADKFMLFFSCLFFQDCPTLNIRTDDLYLTRFLNVCSWNVTESYARLTKLFKLKVNITGIPDYHVFSNQLPFSVWTPEMVLQQKTCRVSRPYGQ